MKWHTASICKQCWRKKYGDAEPRRLIGDWKETCCFCGAETHDEIYVRENAEILRCQHYEEE